MKYLMRHFSMPVIFVDTAQDMQLNRIFINLEYELIPYRKTITLAHRYRYLERPSIFNELKHYRSSQISQSLSTV